MSWKVHDWSVDTGLESDMKRGRPVGVFAKSAQVEDGSCGSYPILGNFACAVSTTLLGHFTD